MGNNEMKMLVIGNFGVISRTIPGNFPEPGTWYDFFTGDSFEILNTGLEMRFEPGEFHIYTTKKIEDIKPNLVPWGSNFVITGLSDHVQGNISIYPNPVNDIMKVQGIPEGKYQLNVIDLYGRTAYTRNIEIHDIFETSLSAIPAGLYTLSLVGAGKNYNFKLLKK